MKTILVSLLGAAGLITALYFGGAFNDLPSYDALRERYLESFKTNFWVAAIITTAIICFFGMILRASFLKISFVAFMAGNLYFAAIYFMDPSEKQELDDAIVDALVPYFGAGAPVIFTFFTASRLMRARMVKKD